MRTGSIYQQAVAGLCRGIPAFQEAVQKNARDPIAEWSIIPAFVPLEDRFMFRNLRFYRITSPWPKNEEELSKKLAENPFSPCGAYSEKAAGWEMSTLR